MSVWQIVQIGRKKMANVISFSGQKAGATHTRDGAVDGVACPPACVHACVYMFAVIMLQPLMSNPGVPCLLPDDRCLARPLGDSQIT